jgi:excisionase family DNA binding protein
VDLPKLGNPQTVNGMPDSLEKANRSSPHESQRTWWTVQQLASYYGISPRTVYQAIDEGRLPAHRFGSGRGGIRIADADRRAWEITCRANREQPLNFEACRANSAATRLISKHLDL